MQVFSVPLNVCLIFFSCRFSLILHQSMFLVFIILFSVYEISIFDSLILGLADIQYLCSYYSIFLFLRLGFQYIFFYQSSVFFFIQSYSALVLVQAFFNVFCPKSPVFLFLQSYSVTLCSVFHYLLQSVVLLVHIYFVLLILLSQLCSLILYRHNQ